MSFLILTIFQLAKILKFFAKVITHSNASQEIPASFQLRHHIPGSFAQSKTLFHNSSQNDRAQIQKNINRFVDKKKSSIVSPCKLFMARVAHRLGEAIRTQCN